MQGERVEQSKGLSRRDFLWKAGLALAAAAGLGAVLRRLGQPSRQEIPPLELEEDSLFTPRADQRERVLGQR